MSRREEILAKSASDRYLPPSRLELLRILQDPDASAATLTRAIECDPTLTANVLRLANSAYFGFPRSVASVADAVWRLGTRNLRQLVLATTFSPMQKQAVKGYDLPAGDLLRHSVAVAVGAETLSRLLDVPACDHLFTAGILHDIGKIALGTFVELDAAPILELATREGLQEPRSSAAFLKSLAATTCSRPAFSTISARSPWARSWSSTRHPSWSWPRAKGCLSWRPNRGFLESTTPSSALSSLTGGTFRTRSWKSSGGTTSPRNSAAETRRATLCTWPTRCASWAASGSARTVFVTGLPRRSATVSA